jgi:Ca2+-binding EF-hand superfamily protein
LSLTRRIFQFLWCDFILGSGLLEFGEFCQLAAKFLVEEDEEGLKKELKEAFRIYDKEGNILWR